MSGLPATPVCSRPLPSSAMAVEVLLLLPPTAKSIFESALPEAPALSDLSVPKNSQQQRFSLARVKNRKEIPVPLNRHVSWFESHYTQCAQ